MKRILLSTLLLAAGPTGRVMGQVPVAAANQPQQFCRVEVIIGLGGRILAPTMYYGQESKVAPIVDSELAAEAAQVHTFDS